MNSFILFLFLSYFFINLAYSLNVGEKMGFKLIYSLVIPFLDDGTIDFNALDKIKETLLKSDILEVVFFQEDNEGNTLTLEEKMKIMERFDHRFTRIYYFNFPSIEMVEKEIELIQELNPDRIIISLPSYPYPQKGIFIYYKNLFSRLSNYPISLDTRNLYKGSEIKFITIKKLASSCKNFVAVLDNSNDQGFIYLLQKNLPDIEIYLDSSTKLKEALDSSLNGLITSDLLLYYEIEKEIVEDYQNGFIDQVMMGYLKFVGEIINEYVSPLGIKYLMHLKGYPSMNVRLPLFNDLHQIDNHLDLLI